MRITYCTTLDDAYFFLNQSKGLPEIPSSVSLRQRYLRACILFSWIALEEMLDYAVEDLLDRKLLKKAPHGRLWDRIKAVLVARGVSSPDQQEFLNMRRVRNLLTHKPLAVAETHLLIAEQAQAVLDYCLRTIREIYPYNVTLRV